MWLWLGFFLLGGIWGSSFLLIKIGVGAFTPLQLVALRVIPAAILLVITAYATGRRLPAGLRDVLSVIFVGIFNVVVPFMLITWGETQIDSGLATVLNATVPLFSLVIAHFMLADERITFMRVLGLMAGFIGVIILASRSAGTSAVTNSLLGQLAILGASACYAGATVFVRWRLRHLQPLVVSSGALLSAAVTLAVLLLLLEGLPDFATIPANVLLSVVLLAVLNTYVAYLLFYWLLDRWGATRTTLVTYLMPPVGLFLGAVFLDEVIDLRLLLGALLIVAGVALVNSQDWFKRMLAQFAGRRAEDLAESPGKAK